jgi:hypothetical protein
MTESTDRSAAEAETRGSDATPPQAAADVAPELVFDSS